MLGWWELSTRVKPNGNMLLMQRTNHPYFPWEALTYEIKRGCLLELQTSRGSFILRWRVLYSTSQKSAWKKAPASMAYLIYGR
jgi:hypothetical protein